MNKFVVFIAVIYVILTFVIIGMKSEDNQVFKEIPTIPQEKRATYISYIELNKYIKDKNEETSSKSIDEMIKNIKGLGFNMIILHVRPFSDSIYKSIIYPASKTVLNDEGKYPNYDILEYFINKSHENEIELHAWINPYRISNQKDEDVKPVVKDYKILDNGIYYNPASEDVRKLIISGIKEIIENYDVDGIHFDDYFYPDKTIDVDNYNNYVKNGGQLTLSDYRLENTTKLIKEVYDIIKAHDKEIEFGIAPEGNIDNNYNNNFIDTKKLLSKEGYIDYIMPQIYFGFLNETKPFIETLYMWNSLIKSEKIKLIPALAFYKTGLEDQYAKSGSNEWKENDNIIKKQILTSRNTSNYMGFSIFRYDYLFSDDKKQKTTDSEINNMKSVLIAK